MGFLTKREWAGVGVAITGALGALLFLASFVFGAMWLRSAYTGPLELGALWTWMSDPANRSGMEPVLFFISLVLTPVMWVFYRLCDRLRENQTVADGSPTKATAEWNAIRSDLIKTVSSHWIKDYLQHSLFKGVRLKLGAEQAPEAMEHPFHVERRSTGKVEHITGASLLKLFDASGGLLLIQGNPGSGKTFTLVTLLEKLLKRADADPSSPVPVVVPLASWAAGERPLDQWLATELSHHYGLSARTTPGLLTEGKRLTLLLDGLDEVKESSRAACLTAIQHFMEQFPATAVVICCRLIEYAALPARFSRGESIRLLPLTSTQIDNYLVALKCGSRLEGLRKLVQQDPDWRELASTPLMLNILAVVYATEDGIIEETASPEARRDAIFRRYVRLMLERKERRTTTGKLVEEEAPFTKGQAIHWLQQIAKRMVKDQVTTFYIERLQPWWVKSPWKYGLVLAPIAGVVPCIFDGLSCGIGRRNLIEGLLHGLASWVVIQAFVGLVIWSPVRRLLVQEGPFGYQLAEFVGKVNPVESVRLRTNRGDFRQIIEWAASTLIVLIVCVVFSKAHNPMVVVMIMLMLFPLVPFLLETGGHPRPMRPSQGIRSSAKMSVIGGGIMALVGSGVGFGFGFANIGVFGGGVLGLGLFGGVAVIQHYAIRLAMAWEGTLPFPLRDRKLIAFLDAMRDRLLLTRVGGGWVFIHRELLDYLATEPLGTTPAEVELALRRGAVGS